MSASGWRPWTIPVANVAKLIFVLPPAGSVSVVAGCWWWPWPWPRGHLTGLADAERADDEQRERDDAGAPGADDLDVEAVPEAEEEQAEEDLAGVVAATPERSHRRALHLDRPMDSGASAARWSGPDSV